jgi:hypothetical protein
MRNLLAVIIGGVQTGRLDLTADAARKLSHFLLTIQPRRPEEAA